MCMHGSFGFEGQVRNAIVAYGFRAPRLLGEGRVQVQAARPLFGEWHVWYASSA